jgi:hypothetical protein
MQLERDFVIIVLQGFKAAGQLNDKPHPPNVQRRKNRVSVSPYISGRARTWLKFKNPAAPASAEAEGTTKGAGLTPATGLTYATRPAVPCCLPSDGRGSTRRLPPLRDRGTRSSR